MENQLFNLKLTSKQLARMSKKAEKKEMLERKKLKKVGRGFWRCAAVLVCVCVCVCCMFLCVYSRGCDDSQAFVCMCVLHSSFLYVCVCVPLPSSLTHLLLRRRLNKVTKLARRSMLRMRFVRRTTRSTTCVYLRAWTLLPRVLRLQSA
jgi:hypothetical protein